MAKCKGIYRKGNRFGSDPIPGSLYCGDHQDQAPIPQQEQVNELQQKQVRDQHNRLLSYNIRKIFKSSIKTIALLILGALFSEYFGLNIWPHLLMGIDKIKNAEPKPELTLRLVKKIENQYHVSFYNKYNKCDEFYDYVKKYKILSKLPSKLYFVRTVREIEEEKMWCYITSPFPGYIHASGRMSIKAPYSAAIDKFQGYRLAQLFIANVGKRKIDFMRAEIRFNNNWKVDHIEGDFISNKDYHSIVIYRENLFADDKISANMYLKKLTNKKIKPKDFINKISVTYSWRGVQKTLNKRKIHAFDTLAIENCETDCIGDQANELLIIND